jgi:hypothetical protein
LSEDLDSTNEKAAQAREKIDAGTKEVGLVYA